MGNSNTFLFGLVDCAAPTAPLAGNQGWREIGYCAVATFWLHLLKVQFTFSIVTSWGSKIDLPEM